MKKNMNLRSSLTLANEKFIYRTSILSKVISNWLKHNLGNDLNICEDRLIFLCRNLLILHDNWTSLNNYFSKEVLAPYDEINESLFMRLKINELESKNIYPRVETKPKFFGIYKNIFGIFFSFKNIINFLNLFFSNEQEISTKKKLSIFTGSKYFDLKKKGDFIGYRFIKRLGYKKRKNLKFFLEKELEDFNPKIISLIMPTYLVELLGLYYFLSKFIKIKKIHTWIHELKENPILYLMAILNKNIIVFGYQHGGHYGFIEKTNHSEYINQRNFFEHYCELKYYTKFFYWGLEKDNIYPFKYLNSKKEFFNSRINEQYKKLLIKKNLCFILDSPLNALSNEKLKLKKFCSENQKNFKITICSHPHLKNYGPVYFKGLNNVNSILGSDNYIENNNDIFITSLTSTLFWKLISLKKFFILYYIDELKPKPQIRFYKNIMENLLSLNLIFNLDQLLNSKKILNLSDIIDSNKIFYRNLSEKYEKEV